MGLRPLTCET